MLINVLNFIKQESWSSKIYWKNKRTQYFSIFFTFCDCILAFFLLFHSFPCMFFRKDSYRFSLAVSLKMTGFCNLAFCLTAKSEGFVSEGRGSVCIPFNLFFFFCVKWSKTRRFVRKARNIWACLMCFVVCLFCVHLSRQMRTKWWEQCVRTVGAY